MKEQILVLLNTKLKEQDMATDKYQYRAAIYDCIKLIEEVNEEPKKVVVWKNGDYKIIDGPSFEYENDSDWLVTINNLN